MELSLGIVSLNSVLICVKKNRGCPPENNLIKKNKKGLASVILATNSPISNW